jgi:hypothetical protein
VVDRDDRLVAGGCDVLAAVQLDPIEEPQDGGGESLHQLVRQQPADIVGGDDIRGGDHQEDACHGHADREEQCRAAAPSTMKSAFMTLLAAMVRALWSASARCCTMA